MSNVIALFPAPEARRPAKKAPPAAVSLRLAGGADYRKVIDALDAGGFDIYLDKDQPGFGLLVRERKDSSD